MKGTVVKLDRGFPLVNCESGQLVRCEHATALVKGERMRAVIGDEVEVDLPEGHDKGILVSIEPRRTAFVRRDPAERTAAQVLAANFDLVIVAEPTRNSSLAAAAPRLYKPERRRSQNPSPFLPLQPPPTCLLQQLAGVRRRNLPPPVSPGPEMLWCGARNGRVRSNPTSPGRTPATE